MWVHVADSGRDQLPLPVHPPWGVTLSTVGARDAAAADLFPNYRSAAGAPSASTPTPRPSPSLPQSLVLAGLLPARAPLRPQAFFAGNARWHPVRSLLVNQSREMPDWLDVRDVATDAAGGVDASAAVPFADASQWEVLLDVPGGGWSGRLKFLPLLGRPLVVIDRREWDWISGAVLRPYEHYRPVAATTRGPGNGVDTKYSLDIDDLFAQLAWVRNNAHEAR